MTPDADEGLPRAVHRLFDGAAADDRVASPMAFGSGGWYRRGALVRVGLTGGMWVLDVAIGNLAAAGFERPRRHLVQGVLAEDTAGARAGGAGA